MPNAQWDGVQDGIQPYLYKSKGITKGGLVQRETMLLNR